MNARDWQPRGVHLVGSVPLDSAEAVFRAASAALGDRLRRLPDGETGERSGWIGWQFAVMQRHPQLEVLPPDPASRFYGPRPTFRIRPGTDARQIAFGTLGYADAARASYATFARLQREGVVPPGMRFQVSLPTPLAPILAYVAPEAQEALEPAYTARLLAELDEILAAIPADRLAIQWDAAIEFAVLEGLLTAPDPDPEVGIIERLVRLGDRVPAAVELGYHLCYGDAGHQHFTQPGDTGTLVRVANALAMGLARPLTWLHLPVPRERTDDAYYAPLRDLRLPPDTQLYLGLLHLTDGEEGARARIAAARRAVPAFGVATECGFGRRPPEVMPDLLRLHAALSAPLSHDGN